MNLKQSKQPEENRYQIKRLAKKKYRITETATGRSAITDDPTPFRPTQQVRLTGIEHKEIDLDKLAMALMFVIKDIERDNEEKKGLRITKQSNNTKDFLKRVVSELNGVGLNIYVFGGWAEELRGLIKPRGHKDIDLLMLGFDFAKLDELIKDKGYRLAKNFPWKRAYVKDDILIEVFLCSPVGRTIETHFEHGVMQWPEDTFLNSKIGGLNVASANALREYREQHDRIHPKAA